MKTFIYSKIEENINQTQFEVVETKGKGHTDNICDTLAEKIWAEYSNFCIKNYSVILRHMFDKLSSVSQRSIWVGESADEYSRRVNIEKKDYINFSNTLYQYGKVLNDLANEYDQQIKDLEYKK